MPLHVEGQHIAAVRTAHHAAEAAGITPHAQRWLRVVVERADSGFPRATAGQLQSLSLEVVCRAGGPFTLEMEPLGLTSAVLVLVWGSRSRGFCALHTAAFRL